MTPDGAEFEGEVSYVIVRTSEGDVGIMKNHTNYAATIDYGMVVLTMPDGTRRAASCIDGFVSVQDNLVRIIATTFEFADDIDVERAERAKERATERMNERKSDEDFTLAEMKLKRALNRIRVSRYR